MRHQWQEIKYESIVSVSVAKWIGKMSQRLSGIEHSSSDEKSDLQFVIDV